jgi:hypothetical protein
MKIRKRVIFLFLTAVLVNGYVLAGVSAKSSANPCFSCCTKRDRCCFANCEWWNLICKWGCATSSEDCTNACLQDGNSCQVPESCPEN